MRETEAEAPEIIFVSPYLRTLETLRLLKEEWPELAGAVNTARSGFAKRIMGSRCSITTGAFIMCCIRSRDDCTICWATTTIVF